MKGRVSKGWAIGLLALAASIGPAATPPRKATAPVRTNWLNTVTQTRAGAFVLGNPAAKVRLAEYMSYTCSHCAAFDAEGMPALRERYIARGQVALEVHHAIRDAFDTTAALLARCEPKRFFAVSHAIMAQQEAWLARAAKYQPPATPGSDEAALEGIAQATGLDRIASAQGVALARQKTCLASAPMLAELGAMRQEAWTTRAIQGTPAFFVNGADQGVTSWAALAPKLAGAVR